MEHWTCQSNISGKQSTAKAGPGVCRFCGASGNTGLLAIGNVCADPDCQVWYQEYCRVRNFHG